MLDLTISRESLAKMLARAVSCVAPKSPTPILQCVLLNAVDDGQTLHVLGTDTFLSARSRGEAKVNKPGAICVDARKLFDFVKALPSGDIRLTVKETSLEVKASKPRMKMSTTPAEDFPVLPSLESSTSRVSTAPPARSCEVSAAVPPAELASRVQAPAGTVA